MTKKKKLHKKWFHAMSHYQNLMRKRNSYKENKRYKKILKNFNKFKVFLKENAEDEKLENFLKKIKEEDERNEPTTNRNGN